MKNKNILFICQAAMIAALYIVLTFIANTLGLANYAIQVRFSEALTILPYFTPAAIPGLTIGCLFSNWLTGCALTDIIFGTAATLAGALLTYALRRFKWLAPLPPIAANTLIIPWVLRYAYGISDAVPFLMLTVGCGEFISAGIMGIFLLLSLERFGKNIFKVN